MPKLYNNLFLQHQLICLFWDFRRATPNFGHTYCSKYREWSKYSFRQQNMCQIFLSIGRPNIRIKHKILKYQISAPKMGNLSRNHNEMDTFSALRFAQYTEAIDATRSFSEMLAEAIINAECYPERTCRTIVTDLYVIIWIDHRQLEHKLC